MRALLLVPLLVATPAFAADRPPRPSAADAARLLQNPRVQDGAAQVLVQLANIVLDTRVGPVATLADPDVSPQATLRDLRRRDDPHFEARLDRDARRAVRTAGAVAGGTLATAGELRRTADRLQAALAPLMDALGAAREGE